MADTTTPNIKITNQTEGGNNNTWGTIADDNFERIDNKFGDMTSITTTGGDTTLTDTQEIVATFYIDGTLASNANIIFSGRGGVWIIHNDTAGDYTLTAKVSGQTGITIPQGTKRIIWCNGTDIVSGYTEEGVVSEATVASASTCDILGAGTEFIAISGTTTITSFGTGADSKRFVRATGAFKITHNATSLICPGGYDITTVAGDTFIVISDSSSNCRIYAYSRNSFVPPRLPIGTIADFAGSSAPTGWLLCYGQEVSRTTYAALFALLGTTYGAGDASTTFNLPDCRGRVRAGLDNMGGSSAARLSTVFTSTSLGQTGGAQQITLTSGEIPAHTHSFSATTSTDGAHTHFAFKDTSNTGITLTSSNYPTYIYNVGNPSSGYHIYGTTSAESNIGLTSSNGDHTHTISGTTGSSGTGGAHDNVQPTIVFNTIIYAGV